MATANGKEGGPSRMSPLRSHMGALRGDRPALEAFKTKYRTDAQFRQQWQTNPVAAQTAASVEYLQSKGLSAEQASMLVSQSRELGGRTERDSARPSDSGRRRVTGPDVTFTNVTDGSDHDRKLLAEAETASALYALGLSDTQARGLANFRTDQNYGNVKDLMAQWKAQQDQSDGGQK